MSWLELARFVGGALTGQRLRSALSALGVAIGIAAVVLLTSLGEGTREYMVGQFTQFGTTFVIINPGKVETTGMPGVLGGTTHQLDVADAEALLRVPEVEQLVPIAFGSARVEGNGRGRDVIVNGVGHQAAEAWKLRVDQGSFLPEIGLDRRGSHAVLGAKLARELFGLESPLGKRVRIGGLSFLVVGVMEAKGQVLGFDLDDTAYIPVATAMTLFNLAELHEIDLVAASDEAIPRVVERARQILIERHRGEEDFTIQTQTEMLASFGRIMDVITVAVSGIAGISLFVGAMGILTIMWISVHERTGEIGLLRAIGVSQSMVLRIFLLESTLLALAGGVAGLGAGFGIAALARLAVPDLPFQTPPGAVVAALVMSLAVGVISGVAPARRAAGLDPIEALRAE